MFLAEECYQRSQISNRPPSPMERPRCGARIDSNLGGCSSCMVNLPHNNQACKLEVIGGYLGTSSPCSNGFFKKERKLFTFFDVVASYQVSRSLDCVPRDRSFRIPSNAGYVRSGSTLSILSTAWKFSTQPLARYSSLALIPCFTTTMEYGTEKNDLSVCCRFYTSIITQLIRQHIDMVPRGSHWVNTPNSTCFIQKPLLTIINQ